MMVIILSAKIITIIINPRPIISKQVPDASISFKKSFITLSELKNRQ